MANKRVDLKAIMRNPVLRRKLAIRSIISIQAVEGITTTEEQAARAYDKVVEEPYICMCGHHRADHNGFGPSRGRPIMSACGSCKCNQWRPSIRKTREYEKMREKSTLYLRQEDVVEMIREMAGPEETDVRTRFNKMADNIAALKPKPGC